MTIDEIKKGDLLILECISGSRAYGLNTPESDTDIKGVFVLPKNHFYGLDYVGQVSNESNDIVYYELGRYVELLIKNNPNILELLATPDESVLHKDPIIDELKQELVLSRLCEKTFGNFAMAQIRKAKGLNKKIVNPFKLKKKSILDFCFINYDNGSRSLTHFLNEQGLNQENCGLVSIPNMKDMYGLYHSTVLNYVGIVKNENSDSVSLSSIPKGENSIGCLYFNQNGYSSYCKEYREYWAWVANRNDARYQNTIAHGKNYDSKNMMHTFRLLDMAIEIAQEKKVNVKRNNRDYLLKIKSGHYEYDKLVELAQNKFDMMKQLFTKSDLPEKSDVAKLKSILVKMRLKLYS